MKIKTLLQAPLILEELKRLNIDPTTLDPQTRVKLKDGCLVFESEKECFVSKPEAPEYQYLDIFHTLLEGDECSSDLGKTWSEIGYYGVGSTVEKWKKYIFRRKIQKPIEEPKYYYLQYGEIIQKGDEYFDSSGKWLKAYKKPNEIYTKDFNPIRRKIQKNPTL